MLSSEIKNLIDRGALFVINHSGGKDSQAMMIKLLAMGIPARQLVVVHADLHEVEWEKTMEHARAQAEAAGLPFIVARAVTGRGAQATDKSFYDMVRLAKQRNVVKEKQNVSHFPTGGEQGCRECTSALKRDPINRDVKRYMKQHGFTLVVSCEGLRAEESQSRANAPVFERDTRWDGAGRTGWTWLPIHAMTTFQVFSTIAMADQKPHWAYASGNSRLSCVFCIMASESDLKNGARLNPAMFEVMAKFEDEIGGQLHMSRKTLREICGEAVALAA